ncbi:MAG: hypothetical protein IPO87_15260 [Flavobacteriales bacterium]|nr:hypothetical protein [Flavobacteriales bacterium]
MTPTPRIIGKRKNEDPSIGGIEVERILSLLNTFLHDPVHRSRAPFS